MTLRVKMVSFFLFMALFMSLVVIWSSLESSVLKQSFLFDQRWFVTTFIDLYLALLIIFSWVCITSNSLTLKIFAFFVFIVLGNIGVGLVLAWRAYQSPHNMTWGKFIKGDCFD